MTLVRRILWRQGCLVFRNLTTLDGINYLKYKIFQGDSLEITLDILDVRFFITCQMCVMNPYSGTH